MNRQRGIPRQHRRYSLPATPTAALTPVSPTIPEGSDIFQKALEDLATHEPNHAPAKTINPVNDLGFNGLNNIQELNESDYVDSDDVEDGEEESTSNEHTNRDLLKPARTRRHSSPSLFTDRCHSETPPPPPQNNSKSDAQFSATDSVTKRLAQMRKDYFSKHGYWPASNGKRVQTPRRRATSLNSDFRKCSLTKK